MSKSKSFVFTINDIDQSLTNDDCEDLGSWIYYVLSHCSQVLSFVFQFERVQHLHVQGYVRFNNAYRFSKLRDIDDIFEGAALQNARGSAHQNLLYCTKQDSRVVGPWQFGEFPAERERTDIKRAIDIANDTRSLKNVALECPETFVKYHQGMQKYVNFLLCDSELAHPPCVVVLWGQSGAGKTESAKAILRELGDYYRVPPVKRDSSPWFDGYFGQRNILIDEFKDSRWSYEFLLSTLSSEDQLPTKGGFTRVWAEVIIITCMTNPAHWYSNLFANQPELAFALERRIKFIYRATGRYPDTTWECEKFTHLYPFWNRDENFNRCSAIPIAPPISGLAAISAIPPDIAVQSAPEADQVVTDTISYHLPPLDWGYDLPVETILENDDHFFSFLNFE